jgi:thiamine biosynthesis protein ThiI
MGHTGKLSKAQTGIPQDCHSRPRILLHAPDITLKGRNQEDFRRCLLTNTRERLGHAGFPWHVGAARGRMQVDVPEQDRDEVPGVLALLQQIPGVSSLALARWLRSSDLIREHGGFNWPFAEREAVMLARDCFISDASFAIRVNRADKALPANSMELGKRLGAAIRRESGWDQVDLTRPDQVFYLDVYPDGFYLYSDKRMGVGGLPVGSGGRVLALLSGGIDSPVAVFTLAKRGCSVDFLHFSAGHVHPGELQQSVIARLACRLSEYTRHSRLFVAPYTYFDLELGDQHSGYGLILFRRFMMRCAEVLADRIHARALVNGDSLGQVASQTLENLVSASRAVSIPILRPLIGSNKEEIITLARRIGTYEISIEPYKDCCALIAQNPRTRSRHEHMVSMEQELLPEYDQLIDRTLQDMVCLEYKYGVQVKSQSKLEPGSS